MKIEGTIISPTGEDKQRLKTSAAADWELFLKHRTKELVPGIVYVQMDKIIEIQSCLQIYRYLEGSLYHHLTFKQVTLRQ